VLSSRALPIPSIPYQRMDSSADHLALTSDREVLHTIKRFLQGESVGPIHQP
jgi:hypothetical protein